MNNTHSLLILVNTLTKAEKRYFQLYTKLQSGDKVYLSLFNMIDTDTSAEDLHAHFCEIQDGRNYEIAVKHLYKTLLGCLIKLRKKQDIQTQIFNYLSKANILFEREMFEEAFLELDKAKKLSKTYENDPLLLLIRRTELKYLNALNFETISEKELVNKQMKINETLKYSRNLNQHMQLYEILRYRLIHKGFVRSDKQKDGLNDLVLSELHLIANTSYQGFEAEKLHLLFQATYYLNSGNYKSAIRYYQEILNLFKENSHLIQNAPVDFLNAILGAIESLRVTGLYKEMPFFIDKLKEMEQGDHPAEFVFQIKTLSYLHELNILLQTGCFQPAKEFFNRNEEFLLKKSSLLNLENQLQLHLSSAILHIYTNDCNEARKCMKKIFGSGKLYHILPSFKITRLINLLVQAELGNLDFFESEISSIKRSIGFEKQVYITEKLLFKFVLDYPLPSYEKSRNKLWQKYQKYIQKIEQDKYERHLLKTFDVLAWIEHKLTRRPLADILEEKSRSTHP